jgi:glyoxylase-like metal-dependent hydrolase (beta-lactamase superfamily II)
MQRIIALAVLFGLVSVPVLPHGDDSHFSNRQDVEFKTTNLTGNVYLLQGRGGNIGAITGTDGILIVDDDYRAMSQKLSDALKALGSAKPRFILNTHYHGDHTEGNEFFGKDSTIIAHVNVRKRMSQPNFISLFNRTTPASPVQAWPIITYTESMSVHVNGDDLKVMHFPSGHTDGDSVVFFTKANVVHLGDDFFVGRFPFVDIDGGGSVNGLIHNIGTLITLIKPDAKIIPGHGPLATLDDLRAFYRLLVETSNIVQDGMKAGKTLDDLKKAGLPEKYKEAGSGFINTPTWIEIVYRSYSKK